MTSWRRPMAAMSPRTFRLVCCGGFFALLILFLTSLIVHQEYPILTVLRNSLSLGTSVWPSTDHAVGRLVRAANLEFDAMLKEEAHTLEEAAKNYRTRRGRHPPPRFEHWWKLAKEKDTLVIESMFDQIYTDLEPFWGKNAHDLREFPSRWPNVLTIRNNEVGFRVPVGNFWLAWWIQMIQQMPYLPDVDMAMNVADEPWVIVPFYRMTDYMVGAHERRHRHNAVPLTEIRNEWLNRTALNETLPSEPSEHDLTPFTQDEYWDLIVESCRPTDPVITHPEQVPLRPTPPVFSKNYTAGTMGGFVQNITTAKSVCQNPNIRTLHGHIIANGRDHLIRDLMPVFGVAKLGGISNDILVPVATNWDESSAYAGLPRTIPWKDKWDAAIWRGGATDGIHHTGNWWGFHRHRLVAIMNGTLVSNVEADMVSLGLGEHGELPSYARLNATAGPRKFNWRNHNFAYPRKDLFDLAALSYHKLGEWAGKISDAGFTHLMCWPMRGLSAKGECNYTGPYYHAVPKVNLTDIMHYKYLPDVDGYSTSGRFRGFIQSLSVPIKASIFIEWHTSRLIPWRHFVPMTVENQEWWGLMQYFIGYKASARGERSVKGHDSVGKAIGQQGSDWINRVERREDMVLYFYRLILEWGRITADERIYMGYVDDLLAKK